MKKNRLLIIVLLIGCFFTFGITSNAQTNYFDYSKVSPQIIKQVQGTQAGGSTNQGIDLCKNAGVVKSFQIVGYGLVIIKIVAPLILLILGIIDISKAIISSDDKAIHSAVLVLAKRAIAAVVIFFVPTIINTTFKLVASSKEAKTKFGCLTSCLSKPKSCKIPANDLFK